MNHPEFTANWHSHTFRCKHAAADVSDYCAIAVKAGLQTIGISDHSPTKDGRWSGVRMDYDQMPDYISAIDRARIEYPQLNIFKGLECEWVPEFGKAYYTDELRAKFGLEYIVAAPHSFTFQQGDGIWNNSFARKTEIDQKAWTIGYGRYVLETIGTGLFDFLAHPDLFGCFCTSWTAECTAISRDIAQAARDARLPLEINTSGIRKPWVDDDDGTFRAQYPVRQFWKIVAEEGATAIINTDAHSPELIAATVDEAYDLAENVGLKVFVPTSPAEFKLIFKK